MYRMQFELIQKGEDLSGFELGHVEVNGASGSVSSRNRMPDQAMMIFPSIVGLLDGIGKLLSNKRLKKFEWVGNDSSFSIDFSRVKPQSISVSSNGKSIAIVDELALGEAVLKAASEFLREELPRLANTAAVAEDLRSALQEFQEVINKING